MNKPPLGLKAPKPERGTAKGKAHMAAVSALPCVVCLRRGPSEVHHVFHGRFGQSKASDMETIPLCFDCHRGPDGIHARKMLWADRNGFDYEFMPIVNDMLDGTWNDPREF